MTTGNYQVHIEGDVSGQIAVGNNNIQVQNAAGGVVNVIQPFSRSPFKKRAGPVRYRPRPFPALLDRESESQVVQASLQNAVSVTVFGEGGIGKTTFLSHMAHLPETSKYPDGILYLYVKDQGLDDLLQLLFDSFYSSAGSFMPTAGQLRHHLQGIRAVILLDDLTLSREDAQALVAMLPLSCFVIASLGRSLWGDGEAVSLGGLPEQEQVELFAREIKRPLSEAEKIDALIICHYLQGHPLKIIQVASLVLASGGTISDVKKKFQGTPEPFPVEKGLLARLDDQQKKTLALLGASGGTLIPLGVVRSLLKMPEAEDILKRLVEMGLARMQGGEFGVAGSLAGTIGRLWNLSSWEDALINYFSNWLANLPKDAVIEDMSDLLVKTIQRAGEKNRWQEVVRLGRALERILILRKRWQAWMDILNMILKAARALGDQNTEAWAFHQLGTRALCLNQADLARQFLTQALNIRQAIGDKAGLQVTQHNLGVLQGGAPTILKHKPIRPAESGIGKYLAYGFGSVVALGIMVLIGLWFLIPKPPPQIPGTATVVPPIATFTDTFTSTPSSITPTFTETGTSTLTPTLTPTDTVTASVTPSITPSITPSPTPTITAFVPLDTTGPKAPEILRPPVAPTPVASVNPIYLSWHPVSDPSGISGYVVVLYYNDTVVYMWNSIGLLYYNSPSNQYDLNVYDKVKAFADKNNNGNICGTYTWTVRGRDKAGNLGDVSERKFRISGCVD